MKIYKTDFFYQAIALLLSFIVVHTVYVGLVRPNAEAVLEKEQQVILANQEQGKTAVIERSAWVVLKDYEQEACFVLMFWVMAIIALKFQSLNAQRKLFQRNLIQIEEGRKILPQDVRQIARPIEALQQPEKNYLLARLLRSALTRYGASGSIQDVSNVVRDIGDAEANRLDSELSIVRYITWAIPSIGFIGTVRGIGAALGSAHEAVAGDITSVTASLGVAFNSTFIALLISIVIMFLTHQITLSQERMVSEAQDYCDEHLIKHLGS